MGSIQPLCKICSLQNDTLEASSDVFLNFISNTARYPVLADVIPVNHHDRIAGRSKGKSKPYRNRDSRAK